MNKSASALFRYLFLRVHEKKEAVYFTARSYMGYEQSDCADVADSLNDILACLKFQYQFRVKHGNFNRENRFDDRDSDVGVFTIFLSKAKEPRSGKEIQYSDIRLFGG